MSEESNEQCQKCGGSGRVVCSSCHGRKYVAPNRPCYCGDGRIKCSRCHGRRCLDLGGNQKELEVPDFVIFLGLR